jgi:predicted NACHT family NTPase
LASAITCEALGGQLPTKRSVLYGKAVEVLLMTWNVEGHEPIEQDEALPQLCYIAYAMMQSGIQKIIRGELSRLVLGARDDLTEELGFARIKVTDIIERIESRSSLIMLAGHDIVDGTLTEFYEFRHLTFQEYLTAKAIV